MTGLTYILVVLLFVTVVYFGYYGNVVREGFLTVGDASISAIPEDYRSATDKLLQVSSLKRRFGDLLTNVRPGSYSCKNPPTYPSVIVRLLKDAYWKERSEGERDGEAKRVLAQVARQCGEVKLIEEIVEKLDAKKDESEELTVTEFKGLTLDLVSFQKRELKLDSEAINNILGYPIASGTSGDDVNMSAGSDNSALQKLRNDVVRIVEDAVGSLARQSRSRREGDTATTTSAVPSIQSFETPVRDNFAVSRGNTLENQMAIQTNDIGELKDLSLDIVNRVEKEYENRRGGNAIGLREGGEIGVVGFGGEELPADDAMVVTGLESEPVAESAGGVVVRRGLDERLRVQDMERQIKSRRKNLVNLFFNRVRE